MIMFDCKFGNGDRHDENYGLAISNDGTGGARLYPLFDNEEILDEYYELGTENPTRRKYTLAVFDYLDKTMLMAKNTI